MVIERCELTELLPAQCGCRKHRNSPDPLAVPRLSVTNWFEAAYAGACVACDAPIRPGDIIGRTEDGYLCAAHRKGNRS